MSQEKVKELMCFFTDRAKVAKSIDFTAFGWFWLQKARFEVLKSWGRGGG